MSFVRDHQMLVSWRSTDEEAKHVKEFVEMVCNATMRGLEQRRLDELKESDRSEHAG